MDQAEKLEPYLLLSKNARGKAAADLIKKATEDPALFAFGELFDVPGIKEVRQLLHLKIHTALLSTT